VWLGVQPWRAPVIRLDAAAAGGPAPQAKLVTLFRQGLLTALSNPRRCCSTAPSCRS
jgi:threonine/homoserine/homoserine lactone efflux protein